MSHNNQRQGHGDGRQLPPVPATGSRAPRILNPNYLRGAANDTIQEDWASLPHRIQNPNALPGTVQSAYNTRQGRNDRPQTAPLGGARGTASSAPVHALLATVDESSHHRAHRDDPASTLSTHTTRQATTSSRGGQGTRRYDPSHAGPLHGDPFSALPSREGSEVAVTNSLGGMSLLAQSQRHPYGTGPSGLPRRRPAGSQQPTHSGEATSAAKKPSISNMLNTPSRPEKQTAHKAPSPPEEAGQTKRKKGTGPDWTFKEDEALTAVMKDPPLKKNKNRAEFIDYDEVSSRLFKEHGVDRSGKGCRHRWDKYIGPVDDRNQTEWSKTEHDKLIELTQSIALSSARWKTISEVISALGKQRSDDACERYYNKFQQKKRQNPDEAKKFYDKKEKRDRDRKDRERRG